MRGALWSWVTQRLKLVVRTLKLKMVRAWSKSAQDRMPLRRCGMAGARATAVPVSVRGPITLPGPAGWAGCLSSTTTRWSPTWLLSADIDVLSPSAEHKPPRSAEHKPPRTPRSIARLGLTPLPAPGPTLYDPPKNTAQHCQTHVPPLDGEVNMGYSVSKHDTCMLR